MGEEANEDDGDNTEADTNQANTTDWTENEFMPEDDDELIANRESEKTKEDLEFEQMFEKMAQDCYQERLKETVKPNTKDIAVPMMVKNTKKSYDQMMASTNSSFAATTSSAAAAAAADTTTQTSAMAAGSNETKPASDAIPFVLMVRGGKGGKQQFKQFVAPSDSQLAINLKLQEEKIREEKERVKRLTLNITERIEEEDYQESLMQTQRGSQQNFYARPSKPKFKHQKGAPDADLIFH